MWSHGLKRSGLHSEPQGAGFGGTLRVSHTGPRAGGRPVTEMGAPAQGHVPEADVACSPLGGRSRFPAWTPSRASAPAPHSPVVDAISDGREYSYLIRRQNPTGSSFLEASSHADSLGSSPASAGHQVCDLARVTLSLPASVSASPQRADRSSRLPGVLSGRSESKHLTHRLAMPLLCSLASPKCALHSALPGPPASGVFHAPPPPEMFSKSPILSSACMCLDLSPGGLTGSVCFLFFFLLPSYHPRTLPALRPRCSYAGRGPSSPVLLP